MKNKIVSLLIIFAVLIFLLFKGGTTKNGYVLEYQGAGWKRGIVYSETYKGESRSSSFFAYGSMSDDEPSAYFCGYYYGFFDLFLWIEKCESGMTEDLFYITDKFDITTISENSMYIGVKGFSGVVPGVDPNDGCDEDNYIGGDEVYWIEGSGDVIYSEEQLAAIESATKYARFYNIALQAYKCKNPIEGTGSAPSEATFNQ